MNTEPNIEASCCKCGKPAFKSGLDGWYCKACYDGTPQLVRTPNLPSVRASKVGRNEPCPCGSGKKYKRCCIGPTQYLPAPEVAK